MMSNNCPTNTTVTSVVLAPTVCNTTTTATATTSTSTKGACSGTSVEKLPQLTPSHETNQPLKRSSLSGTTGRTVSKNRHEPKPRSKQNVKKLQRSSKKVWVCGWVSVWVGELSGWVREWVSEWVGDITYRRFVYNIIIPESKLTLCIRYILRWFSYIWFLFVASVCSQWWHATQSGWEIQEAKGGVGVAAGSSWGTG